jgi:hypothetical protein
MGGVTNERVMDEYPLSIMINIPIVDYNMYVLYIYTYMHMYIL